VKDYLDEEGMKHEFSAPTLINKMGLPEERIEPS
jgi:hypothetical protein